MTTLIIPYVRSLFGTIPVELSSIKNDTHG